MLESISMRARIYLPPKSAMQSGRAGSGAEWVLHYDSAAPERADPLMGWIGGGDTQSQVFLHFPTKEEAIAYAERNGIPYDLEIPRERRLKIKAYADNFSYRRNENWTH
jgi:ETC complex I subunit conserved region